MARITGFRGRDERKENHFAILDVGDAAGVEQLVGARVTWRTPTGRSLHGKIMGPHGQKRVLARFTKGLPGTAIGNLVELKTAAQAGGAAPAASATKASGKGKKKA